ncbi:hypothetical protein BJ742DRAFT_792256 [Cladochytrium replicatum]|nr:hypothetical protein BJ742DRAFT_792256 [Cladochytrium replicatum]
MSGTQDPDAVIGFTAEEFESGINLIFYLAMTIIPLNISGSIYVLVRILTVTLQTSPAVIPASLRLPFYVVFIDLLCSFTFTAETVHLFIARRTPDQPYAAVLGGCVTFVLVCNFILVTQAAFFSWNRIVRKKAVDHGPYDVKLLAPAVLVAASVVVIYASIGALGANNYYCWIRKSAYGAVVFLVLCCLASILALWFFYIWIMVEIYKLSRGSFLTTIFSFRPTRSPSTRGTSSDTTQSTQELSQNFSTGSEGMSSGNSNISVVERQFIMKICMYMLACFVQYLPGIPYATSFLFPTQPYALYVMAVISINLGGVVNATALILNEGLGRKAMSNDGGVATTSYYPTSNVEWTTSAGGARNWGRVPFVGVRPTEQTHEVYSYNSPENASSGVGLNYQFQTRTLYPGPGYPTSPPRLYPPGPHIQTSHITEVNAVSRESR